MSWALKYVTSAVAGESIPEVVKGKSFYDLKATLPGSKGQFDFVSDRLNTSGALVACSLPRNVAWRPSIETVIAMILTSRPH